MFFWPGDVWSMSSRGASWMAGGIDRLRFVSRVAGVGALAIGALAGCGNLEREIKGWVTADDPPSTTPAVASTPAAPASTPGLKPDLTPLPAAAETSTDGEPGEDAEQPDQTAEAVPFVEIENPSGPDQLIGRDRTKVASLIGWPREEREAPPAKIWEYAGADCTFTVYFYLNLESETFRALRYDSSNRGDTAVDPAACFAGLRERQSES